MVCMPERIADVYAIIQQELFGHARISVHHGKTQVWNRGGVVPQDIGSSNWASTVCASSSEGSQRNNKFFERMPLVNDPQAGWLLLWMRASTRADFWLRMVSLELTLPFAVSHDRNVWQCLQTWMFGTTCFVAIDTGRSGLCQRRKDPSCCALGQLGPLFGHGPTATPDRDAAPCLAAVRQCREVLAEANFHPPGWRDLAVVVPERAEEVEPNQPKCASRSLETMFLNE